MCFFSVIAFFLWTNRLMKELATEQAGTLTRFFPPADGGVRPDGGGNTNELFTPDDTQGGKINARQPTAPKVPAGH